MLRTPERSPVVRDVSRARALLFFLCGGLVVLDGSCVHPRDGGVRRIWRSRDRHVERARTARRGARGRNEAPARGGAQRVSPHYATVRAAKLGDAHAIHPVPVALVSRWTPAGLSVAREHQRSSTVVSSSPITSMAHSASARSPRATNRGSLSRGDRRRHRAASTARRARSPTTRLLATSRPPKLAHVDLVKWHELRRRPREHAEQRTLRHRSRPPRLAERKVHGERNRKPVSMPFDPRLTRRPTGPLGQRRSTPPIHRSLRASRSRTRRAQG